MHINIRRSIAGAFILFFLASVVPLVLVTAGLLYNPKKNVLEKTALVIIESDPKGALVQLNDTTPQTWWSPYIPFLKTHVYYTPTRLHYLIPDSYKLSLSKQGYITFETTLTLLGGQTSILPIITLWPDSALRPVVLDTHNALGFSPKGTYIAAVDPSKKLILSNPQKNVRQAYDIALAEPQNIWWDENELYITTGETSTITNIALATGATSQISIAPYIPLSFTWIRPGQIGVVQTSNTLLTLSFDTNTVTQLPLPGLQQVLYEDDQLWALTDGELVIIRNNTIAERFALETSDVNRVIFSDGAWLYVTNEQGSVFRFHKPTKQWHQLPLTNILGIRVETAANEAVWWNEFEVGTIKLDNNMTSIITRIGEPIHDVLVIKRHGSTNIILATTNSVIALDPIQGGGYRSTVVASIQNLKQMTYLPILQKIILETEESAPDLPTLWEYPVSLE